jgi:hypothetical protein
MFFTSSVFLKFPQRVAAAGLIMALCLLVLGLLLTFMNGLARKL